MKKFVLVIVLMVFSSRAFAIDPDEILGVWANGSGKGHMQIFKQHGKYYGKVIWLKQPNDALGNPRTDKMNANEKLKSRPILGMIMLRDMHFDDEKWVNGKIYNPDDGKEYSCILRLKDRNSLLVRGYLGFTFIGKTDRWSRIK